MYFYIATVPTVHEKMFLFIANSTPPTFCCNSVLHKYTAFHAYSSVLQWKRSAASCTVRCWCFISLALQGCGKGRGSRAKAEPSTFMHKLISTTCYCQASFFRLPVCVM